jgi:hypothetical protein
MGKKVIRLTESDLIRVIKRVIKEDENYFDDEDTTFGGSDYNPKEVLHIPNLRGFGDVNNLLEYIYSNNIRRWSFGDSLELNGAGEKWSSVYLSENDLQALQGLEYIEGYLDLSDSEVSSLGNLKVVGDKLNLSGSRVKTLGNLKQVRGSLLINNSSVESLGDLKFVGHNALLSYSEVKNLGNLTHVGGDLYLEDTEIKTFGKLRSVKELYLNYYLRMHYTDDEIRSMVDVKYRIHPSMDDM